MVADFSQCRMKGWTWADGHTYEGEFSADKINGQGVLSWSDGRRYEGHFDDEKQNGKGIWTWPDKSRYEGQFKNDQICGQGELQLIDGRRFKGDFQAVSVWNNSNSAQSLVTSNGSRLQPVQNEGVGALAASVSIH